MPTAAEHRAEASSLSDVLDTVRSIRTSLVRDRDDVGVRGGSTFLVTSAIGAAVTDLDELGRGVALVVDELHRRADLCEQYTLDVRRYEIAHQRWESAVEHYRATADTDRASGWPGPEPDLPRAPFPGAVAG